MDFSTPFARSLEVLFESSLNLQLTLHPALTGAPVSRHEVSVFIGLTGDVEGVVELNLGIETAWRLASLYAGIEISATDPDLDDALGELLNVIAGRAKAHFKGRISLGSPWVLRGPENCALPIARYGLLQLACESDCGPLALILSLAEAPRLGCQGAEMALQSGQRIPEGA